MKKKLKILVICLALSTLIITLCTVSINAGNSDSIEWKSWGADTYDRGDTINVGMELRIAMSQQIWFVDKMAKSLFWTILKSQLQ
jgi:hypothetical protein